MNEKRKKIMKIIIAIVALAMIISTFAGIFGTKSSSKQDKTVTKENIKKEDKKEINEKVSKDIPEQAKKDIQNAKVQIKENVVNGTIVLNQELNQVQLDKIAETYGKTLSEKYKDKEIKVKVVHKNQVASDFSTSNINVGKGIPKAQVEIAPGVVMSNRYVRVILDTPNPEKYSVEVLGKKLEYRPKNKYFHNVIESYDEQAIKKAIKITVNK
ncbi:hypothetical protein FDJ70_06545 [Clostridium botulinum]|uniref:Uncharacterized protein n=1 Tax=Clostridium botulinum D str. 1873 TaxID=592027 RepID=A0A9P2G7F6_CLOBO|nr:MULTISPECIES: hypothetical protein [Clostridium]AYF53400.1 hypothetical protein DFH04_00920 [Clostridium novyi]EES91362.1 conserved hypothetical protein [Clostridium botulinum D str. 1873]MBO3442791.1 hypothetical protein [Clostridium haemolyticum]MCD3216015.1 hypothetical protein [Clostridium botulinum C]MCD3245208.1 hypothetical protein [Clostridium botulinum C]